MQKNTQFENLPPTMAALQQHTKRDVYQGAIIWGQALENYPELPSPDKWGWKKNSNQSWDVFWTHLDPISDVCKELCKCSCSTACGVRCSCKKSNLECTPKCKCPCRIGK